MSIFRFWVPLAATWTMMAVEGPLLAAVIARMPEPAFNLAAYGVAWAFALLVEAPVIMLMSASTALAENLRSYRRLRTFTHALTIGATASLLIVLLPPVFARIAAFLSLPDEIARITRGSLWILLPWPGAIAYRRLLQGLLIRSGRTRLVATGTVLRLSAMAGTALILYAIGALPGAWVGAAALSTGVLVEAAAARFMARGALHDLHRDRTDAEPPPYRDIARFYWPLALTSMIGLTVQPVLTFFMGHAPRPIESLAVLPVVIALAFFFRAPGLSYQEAAIALLGRNLERYRELARFATVLGLTTSALFALVVFTPFANFWFHTVSGLEPDLAALAVPAARFMVPLPALSVLLSLQRAVLVQRRSTRPISIATAIEVGAVAITFAALGWWIEMIGVIAAGIALATGRIAANAFLAASSGVPRSLRFRNSAPAPPPAR